MGGLFEDLSGDGVFAAMSIVQQADETAAMIHEELETESDRQSWFRAERLWKLKEQFGETDDLIGERHGWSRQYVHQMRCVWETFGDQWAVNPGVDKTTVHFKHCREALTWEDAPECLLWADENDASAAEMKAWRRMQNGEDLTVDSDSPETDDASGGQTEHEAPESQPGGPSTFRPDAGGEAPERHVRPAKAKATAAPKAAVTQQATSWTLSELQALLTGAEDTTDAGERKKLAAWHLKRAEQLAPKRKSAVFRKPTVDEVSEYVRNAGSNVDPQQFVDFYESKGWKVGATAMRDWKAACRNWSRRESGTGKRSILDGLKRFADGGEG
jgi:hypothetical protein